MAVSTLRPPTPNMEGRELVQWLQRVYDVLLEYQTTPDPEPTPTISSHDELTENGGAGSHATLASHLAAYAAHGRSSDLVGLTDVQVLSNKVINALTNTLTGLRHGTEVDNPTAAHGVGTVVGTTETQKLTNKDIRRKVALHTGGAYAVSLNNNDVVVAYAEATLSLPLPASSDIGKILVLANAGTATNVTVISVRPINGETDQVIPPNSSMEIVYDSYAWRIK